MGWTAVQTLEHTPAEVRLARKGRLDLINDVLAAIYGKPKTGPTTLSGGEAPTAEAFARMFAVIEAAG